MCGADEGSGWVGNSVVQRVDHGVVQTFGEIALGVETSEDAETVGELCHAKVSAENQRNNVGRTAPRRSLMAVGFVAACTKAALRFLSTRQKMLIKKNTHELLRVRFYRALSLESFDTAEEVRDEGVAFVVIRGVYGDLPIVVASWGNGKSAVGEVDSVG